MDAERKQLETLRAEHRQQRERLHAAEHRLADLRRERQAALQADDRPQRQKLTRAVMEAEQDVTDL